MNTIYFDIISSINHKNHNIAYSEYNTPSPLATPQLLLDAARRTLGGQLAPVALGPQRRAHRLPEADQQRIDLAPQVGGQPLLEGGTRLLRTGGRPARPAQPVGDAMYVRVDADAGARVPRLVHANVRHFRANAGQRDQLLEAGGNVAVVPIDQNASGLLQVFGFVLCEAAWSREPGRDE